MVPKKVMKDKNRSLQSIMNRYSLTDNPTVRSSKNITAAEINRNTLTDITNNKTVILETNPVKVVEEEVEKVWTIEVRDQLLISQVEKRLCERSVPLPPMKEVTAKKGKNSMPRRSAIIIDKQILPDKHTTVHPFVSEDLY